MAARNHRNRQRRRRGRFGFLYKLLSVLVILCALMVGSVAFFRVNRVEVVGNSRYSAEAIIEASSVAIGDNLFLINRPQTARAIMRALPYVKNVAVAPTLPDTLQLRITESSAVAAVEIGGAWWLMDEDCKLVEQSEGGAPAELPKVLGLSPLTPVLGQRLAVDQNEPEALGKLEGLKGLLSALKGRDMTGSLAEFIDLRSPNAIYFGYGSELTVVVPMSGDFERRILSLQGTVNTFVLRGERLAGTLDLTYGDDRARLLTSRWTPDTNG